MKGSLLFSSYPFISSKKVTLTRVTDMDLEALWQILGDEAVPWRDRYFGWSE